VAENERRLAEIESLDSYLVSENPKIYILYKVLMEGKEVST
jgi:hypothetical protein